MKYANYTEIRSSEPDLESGLFLASICGQAYNQFFNFDSGFYFLPNGYEHVGTIFANRSGKATDRYGFVITSDICSIVAFRGSSTSVDWIHDFIAQQVDYPYVKNAGSTHKGFTDIYGTIRESMMELLEQLPANKPLFITGHSLGGALATLAAMDIAYNTTISHVSVYTYGAPRVGDPIFVKHYNYVIPVHWRFQNKYDIVPHLPTLVYHSPHTEDTYFYLHVKGEVLRHFRFGTVALNHILQSYFKDLASDMPQIANMICSSPLGWCPYYEHEV